MKTKIFLIVLLVCSILTLNPCFASYANLGQTLKKYGTKLTCYGYRNGVPIFRIFKGPCEHARFNNLMYRMKASIYTKSDTVPGKWDMINTESKIGMKNISEQDLPYPFYLLTPEEKQAIELFVIYKNGCLNIYLEPLSEEKLKNLFLKISKLLNQDRTSA